MDNKVSYKIAIDSTQGESSLRNLGNEAQATGQKTDGLADKMSKLGMASLGVNAVIGAFQKLWGVMEACSGAYEKQSMAEQKLEVAMRNKMGATEDDINAIKQLTAAQQKLGVIGDEVQLSGAQELATFVKQKETIERLLPAMNDMVAQQYGLNATQENAASVATLFGKVMNGQTAALTRYGYSVTDAQEKILKFGTEQEKAATLAQIIEERVGGMNEAMAQTPAGKMQQYSNAMGDVSERLGDLYNRIRVAVLPYAWKMVDALNVMVDVLGAAFSFISDNLDVIAALAVGITALTVAANAHAIAAGIATVATGAWSAAQAILNALLTANPIGLVIAAIAALVAAILWVSKNTEGWGALWDATTSFMKEVFLAYVESVKTYFSAMVNGIMIGIDKIKLGWYKFKEAVGLGNSEENKRAIEEINAAVEQRQKAIAEGVKKTIEHANKARHAFDNVSISWKSSESASQDPNTSIRAGASYGVGGAAPSATATAAKSSANEIVSGGTRNTNITINFGREMVKMEFNGGYLDNKDEVESTLAESLLRVLSAAKAAI